MYIERIQIEDGFLDGFDLNFRPGLNTLIGARGTGKTSLIELIRFCFATPGFTADSSRRSREHALSILGEGRVIISLRDGSSVISVSRSTNETSSPAFSGFRKPIIFSQTEIEAVGLEPGGRLGLIDAFDSFRKEDREKALVAEIGSMAPRISAARDEIEELRVALSELPALVNKLNELRPSEESLSRVSADAKQKSELLGALTLSLANIAVGNAALNRFKQFVDQLQTGLGAATDLSPSLEAWPMRAGEDILSQERHEVSAIQADLHTLIERLKSVDGSLLRKREVLSKKRDPLEFQSRNLRKEIETLQAGAGEISRLGQQLRERIAQIESLKQLVQSKVKQLNELTARRDAGLDSLSEIRTERFSSRHSISRALNKKLGPRIRVSVEKGANYQIYSSLVAEILKGSGIRYNELAPLVAKSVSPRELLEAAENSDFELISEAIGVSRERALRFVTALRSTDLGRIATVPLEDSVTLSLLDGKDYKSIEELSTGQRCTVVLPIVLRHVDRVVIVDQPEDHIDNAFIADTLIKAILERNPTGQVIFSTHNANIPVLGAANYVVQMGSDGHRGFPVVHGSLEAPEVVTAISTVMEGGADAFRRRAEFYYGHRDDA